MNRLGAATSPYLQQHRDNPVDWWEWSDEAFAEARRRDVPVLLSIGYAACHWCHVMAHESFEHDEVAAVMNEHFVNIKVDREERPDVDAVYMDATVAMSGHGGWPMTCLLTPDAQPFYCGTYFPRDHFVRLLGAIAEAWRDKRDEVVETGQRVVDALAQQSGAAFEAGAPLGAAELDAALEAIGRHADAERGGFGGAPKFPPSMVLEWLLRAQERRPDETVRTMTDRTFEAMARGGMYDQLGGGFARYSVDAAWVVPHFEKMLYDNAQLLRGYLHWWRRTGSDLGARVARQTARFLLRDLRTAEGGFASALDADTDGVEGLTYAWTPTQLAEALGAVDGARAAEIFTVTDEGTFEHGASTLQVLSDPPADELVELRTRLFAARELRPQPARDDKIVTAWNGLAIGALAEAAVMLGEPEFLVAAVECAELLERVHMVGGRLRRASRDGAVGDAQGVAEDYGDLADGLLLLHQATGDPHWLELAGRLLDVALDHFAADDGGFWDTADDAETLVRRPRDPSDNAAPSGSSSLIHALVAYHALTGSARHRDAAERALAVVGEMAVRQPRFFGWALAAAEALASGPVQVAIVGDVTGELAATAWRLRPPGAVVVSGEPDADGRPLLADRPLVNGGPAAYVCRGMVCDLPVTRVADLGAALSR